VEIHHRPNLGLPPLLIQTQSRREELVQSPDVITLVKSRLLLDAGLNELLGRMRESSERLDRALRLLELKNRQVATLWMQPGFYKLDHYFRGTSVVLDAPETAFHEMAWVWQPNSGERRPTKLTVERLISFLDDAVLIENIQLSDEIRQFSKKTQEALADFEADRKCELNILSQRTLFQCRACSFPIVAERFKKRICVCGLRIETMEDNDVFPINVIGTRLRDYISNNLWFEDAIEYILIRGEYQTKCGVMVRGHSGTSHEIDIIAESHKEKSRFFCECKTGDIAPNDVFIFAGKLADIGCPRGYMFTLSKDVTRETVRLARSMNIVILDKVGERPLDELLTKIRW
jgi:hypothetical protein